MKKGILRPLLAAFLVALGPSWSLALSLADIESAIRRHIRDTSSDTSLQRYSDAVLDAYINEAQRDFVNRTWCLQKTTSQSLSAQTTYYQLPNDFIALQEFNFLETSTGRTRQLEERTERALFQENPDYERQAGAPTYYFIRNSTSTATTTLEYGINPVPTSSQLGTGLIDYYAQPEDLDSDADVSLLGFRHLYPYHQALIFYATAQVKLVEGKTAEATSYLQLYDATVKTAVDRLGMLPNYNPGFQVGSGK